MKTIANSLDWVYMQGLVQAAGVALAVLHARYALFEILQRAIGGRPTEVGWELLMIIQ